MPGYYSRKLAAERLQACYDLASEPVRAYLEGEVDFVLRRTASSAVVLELGCGYGRVLARLAGRAAEVVGVDTSVESLLMARRVLGPRAPVRLAAMNAASLALATHGFDLTVCVQNGISAFAVDKRQLLAESVRVTRPGGLVLFSSYAANFWSHRLEWFEAQAAAGLIGEIDRRATGDGVIVGTDGFRATTVSPDGFRALAAALGLEASIVEVAGSSVFCEVVVP